MRNIKGHALHFFFKFMRWTILIWKLSKMTKINRYGDGELYSLYGWRIERSECKNTKLLKKCFEHMYHKLWMVNFTRTLFRILLTRYNVWISSYTQCFVLKSEYVVRSTYAKWVVHILLVSMHAYVCASTSFTSEFFVNFFKCMCKCIWIISLRQTVMLPRIHIHVHI